MDGTFPGSDRHRETRRGRHRAGRHRADRDDFPDASKRWNRALAVMLAVLMLSCGGLATAGFLLLRQYTGQVHREDLLGAARSPGDTRQPNSGPLNLLLLGAESRQGEPDQDEPNQDEHSGQRPDVVMLIHINASRDAAAIISIPRDSYVYVPASGTWGGGMNKLNAAYAFGGAPLAAQTVSELTGVTLDGALVATFDATRRIVDAVGGVDVCLPYAVESSDTHRVWTPGCHHLNGDEADDLARQRHDLPEADLSRIQDQHLVIQALAKKLSTQNLLTNPLQFNKLVATLSDSLIVDKNLDLTKLALALRRIDPSNLKFATAPHSSAGLRTPHGSAVQLDETKAEELFAAVRDDTVTTRLPNQP